MFSYETGQVLIVVLCCIIIVAFVFWVSADVTSNKFIGKSFNKGFNFKSKKSVTFGNIDIKEFDSDED
jgi:hypothetical protein